MSQKAVTDFVAKALGSGGSTKYETVSSIEEMTDTSKSYVLSTTNTLWVYSEKQVYVEHNAYDENTATFNYRISSSGGLSQLGGSLLLDYTEVSYDADCAVTVKGIDKLTKNYSAYFVVDYFDASKNHIGQKTQAQFGTYDGSLPCTINIFKPSQALTNIENTAFVRIKLGIAEDNTNISASDCTGLVVNFSTKNGYKTEGSWSDTGKKPESANGNYVKLLVKINQNASDIYEVSNRVTALETGSETITIPSFWQDAVDECIAKIKALQVGKNCVTFPFFSDHHTRGGYVGMLIAYIMEKCNIPYCFFGGDVINSGYIVSEEVMIQQEINFKTAMSYVPKGRFCRALGNHDGFWNVSAEDGDEYFYSREQCYELFMREESVAHNKYYGEDGTYYYVDDIASKVRFVVLNTNNNDGTGGTSVDSVQFDWLQNTALKFNESGWAVVFISHHPITNNWNSYISNAHDVQSFLTGYINGTSENKADVVGWYSGHNHRDRIYQTDHTNKTSADDQTTVTLPWKTVSITSDHTGIAYDDATKHTVANDNQSHAIDFVTINKTTRTVNLTRLGIGEDRSYTY